MTSFRSSASAYVWSKLEWQDFSVVLVGPFTLTTHSLSTGLSSEILGLDKPLLSARAFPQFPKQLLLLMVLV